MANRLVWDLIVNDRGRAGIESFRRGLRGAAKDTDDFSKTSLGKATKVTAGFTGGMLKATAAIGSGATAMVHSAGAAVAVAQATATASGALLLIPGAIAAGGVAMAAFRVGTSGVSDALKVASDDAEGYAEATKNLSREQVKFTDGIRAQSGAWTEMRKSVGDRLFKGIGDDVKPLADRYLPMLNKHLGSTASGFNRAGKSLADWARSAPVVKNVNTLLGNSSVVVQDVLKGVKPLAAGMLNLFTASSQELPGLTAGIGGVATKFEQWTASITAGGRGGKFGEWIRNGTAELGKLGTGFKKIVAEVSKPEFKAGLSTVWEGMQKSSAAVSKELPAVVDAITALAPAFSNVIAAGGGSFATTLRLTATAALALAPTINFVTGALVPLAPLIGTVGPGLFVFAKGLQAWKAASGAIAVVKGLAGATKGLGIAMTVGLGPVGLIIVGVALLAAGLVVAYKKSEKFRAVCNYVFKAVATDGLKMADRLLQSFSMIFHTLGKVPGKVGAPFRTAGAAVDRMRGKVNSLRAEINRVHGKKVTVTVHTSFYQTGKAPGTYGNGLGVLTGRAAGGPVKAGTPYTVGESGMETFVPTQDGVIVPHNKTLRTAEQGRSWGGGGVHIIVQAGAVLGSKAALRAAVLDAINSAPAGSGRIIRAAVGR